MQMGFHVQFIILIQTLGIWHMKIVLEKFCPLTSLAYSSEKKSPQSYSSTRKKNFMHDLIIMFDILDDVKMKGAILPPTRNRVKSLRYQKVFGIELFISLIFLRNLRYGLSIFERLQRRLTVSRHLMFVPKSDWIPCCAQFESMTKGQITN